MPLINPKLFALLIGIDKYSQVRHFVYVEVYK